jgi:hypothetical protein
MQKRAFLAAALGLGAAGLAASRAVPAMAAQANTIPVRRVKTTLLWKVDGFPNAMDTTPDGIWVGEQTQNGFNGGTKGERAWLFDPATGQVKRQIVSQSYNTSGMAAGGGYVWMIANGGPNGVYQTDLQSRTISHRQIPLGGGGSHGGLWRDGKLWIVANRLKGIVRVDPTSWQPEFMIPFDHVRWHDIAWDNGAIWMVTGTSNGLASTNKAGLAKYDATTGRMLERVEFAPTDPDPHGLTIHNGVMYGCDAGISPGFVPSGSPSAQRVYRIDFV